MARLAVRFAEGVPLNPIGLMDRFERALGAPAQTALKREDEQAFAHANGANPMFCEDAARRILHALDDDANHDRTRCWSMRHRIGPVAVRFRHRDQSQTPLN